MKKTILSLLLSGLLLLSACGGGTTAASEPAEDDNTLHILATTYPVYLFTTAVTEGGEGVEGLLVWKMGWTESPAASSSADGGIGWD